MPKLDERLSRQVREEIVDNCIEIIRGVYNDESDGKCAKDVVIIALQKVDAFYFRMRTLTGGA